MKKLFSVYDSKTSKHEPEYFEDKVEAKKFRNELNEKAKAKARYVINRGEDHLMGASTSR